MTGLVLARRPSVTARVAAVIREVPSARATALLLGLYLLLAVAAPMLLGDLNALHLGNRLKPPGASDWFGTDHLGRSVFDRTLAGTRVSMLVGFSVATAATVLGLAIGVLAGYLRRLDGVLMRIMDGLMAIPGVLLAIALVSLFGSTLFNVVLAIAIPEIPRMARLVRSVVLGVRGQAYVDAAITVGTPLHRLLWRHILPSTIGPVIVQATYACASAIITEAVLSFLGVGTPPAIPSWGGMMAEGRQLFEIAPWVIFCPAVCLSALVLAVNILGDALREPLDPKLGNRGRP
jgi:peptide/nickel transport system permease protein